MSVPSTFDLRDDVKKPDMIDDPLGQMGLIHDAEDVVRSLKCERHEAAVLDDEDLVLWVTDDSRLVLRHLDDGQTIELDDSLRNYTRPSERKPGIT